MRNASIIPLILLAVCVTWATARASDYWPTGGWRNSTPEAQGVQSKGLVDFLTLVQEKRLPIHSFMVVRHDYIVLDTYFYPFEAEKVHDLASVTKSVTSTLTAIALHEGKIAGIDAPMLSLLPGRTPANPSPEKEAIRLRDLLTMRSGLECIAEPGEVTLFEMMASPDWVQFMIDRPMVAAPDEVFVYNSGGSHLLSEIVRSATGSRIETYARERLFDPLGIEKVIWPTDPPGVNNHGWGDLHLTPQALAKLGLLYLRDGVWEGERLLPKGWVESATRPYSTFDDKLFHRGYGFQWWTFDEGYLASGRGGQFIIVYPGLDLIIVTTNGGQGDRVLELIPEYVIHAVVSDSAIPDDPSSRLRLEALAAEVSEAPETTPEEPARLPRQARQVSGRVYRLQPNALGLEQASLTFERRDEATLTFWSNGTADKLDILVGLDGVFRTSPGRFGLPACAKGHWRDDGAFLVEYDEIANINHWRMKMTFEDETVTVNMFDSTGLGQVTLRGGTAN